MNLKHNEIKELVYVFQDAISKFKPLRQILKTADFSLTNSKVNAANHLRNLISLESRIFPGQKMYRHVECRFQAKNWPSCGS